MKREKTPEEMTLKELKKYLPLETERAARLRKTSIEQPDLGPGYAIAADSVERKVEDIKRLIAEKTK